MKEAEKWITLHYSGLILLVLDVLETSCAIQKGKRKKNKKVVLDC